MFLAVMGLMTFTAQYASAQDGDSLATADSSEMVAVEPAAEAPVEEAPAEAPMHQEIKRLFIEGGAGFMATIIACLVFGLAVASRGSSTSTSPAPTLKSSSRKLRTPSTTVA